MKNKYKVLILLSLILIYKGLAYFTNQADYAEVYTHECVPNWDFDTCVYKGKLKRTLISSDYVVDTGKEVITIKKQDVFGVRIYENN